jgi:hypothetical protein
MKERSFPVANEEAATGYSAYSAEVPGAGPPAARHKYPLSK